MRANLSDKTILTALRRDIDAALDEVAGRYGIKLVSKQIRYEADGTAAKITLQATAPEADGTIKSQEEKDFERYCDLYDGLKPEHLHAEITYGLKKYKIVGLRPKARRFPLLARCEGKNYCLPISAVTHNLHDML